MKTTGNPAASRSVKMLVFAVSAVICDIAGRRSAVSSFAAYLVLGFATLAFGIAAALQLKQGIVELKANRLQAERREP